MTFLPDWDKTGTKIKGKYMGIFPYTGIIENTRVMYGNDVQYQVKLMDMIEVYGDWRSTILIGASKDQNNYQLIIE